VPQILFGDIYQPKPTLGPDFDDSFRHQKSVSLYARLIKGGADTAWFSVQHRFVHDVACLVNAVLPQGQLRTSPTVEQRDLSRRARDFFRTKLDCCRSVAFFGVRGTVGVNEFSLSTYNLEHVKRAFCLVMMLLDYGFEASHIGLAAPYTAQVTVYSATLHAFQAWCFDQAPHTKWRQIAPIVGEVQVFTVDGIQGGEVEIAIYDTTVAGSLKFVRDTARNLLAITRPRAGLIIIGSPQVVKAYYASEKSWQFSSSAYYKVWKWCVDNNVYINTANSRHKKIYDRLIAPFEADEVTQRVYRQRADDLTPISFSNDVEFNLIIPDFTAAAHFDSAGTQDDEAGASNNSDSGTQNNAVTEPDHEGGSSSNNVPDETGWNSDQDNAFPNDKLNMAGWDSPGGDHQDSHGGNSENGFGGNVGVDW
jgi:hypothetical protein